MPWEVAWLTWAISLPILVFLATLWWSLRGVVTELKEATAMSAAAKQLLSDIRVEPRPSAIEPSALPTDENIQKTCNASADVIPDDIAKRMIDGWRDNQPSLDSVLHAWDIQRNLSEIKELEKMDVPAPWLFTRPIHVTPRQVGHLLVDYVKLETGEFSAFTLRRGPLPDVCAFDSALRVISSSELDMPLLGLPSGLEIPAETIAEKALSFLVKCRKNGLYAAHPRGDASIFSTFAAVELVRNVSMYVPHMDLAPFDHVDETIASIKQCLKPCGELFAFTYSKERDECCLSADHYALRGLAFASHLRGDGAREAREREREEIHSALRGKEGQFLAFIRSCWVESEGGFAWQPGQEPDILHTRYGLQVLRMLLYNRVIAVEQLDWVKAPSILRYVMGCHAFGGFAVKPNLVPNLYATRAAVSCVKLLEIFRLRGLFAAGWDYLAERYRFHQAADAILDFVAACVPAGVETPTDPMRISPKVKEFPDRTHLERLKLIAA